MVVSPRRGRRGVDPSLQRRPPPAVPDAGCPFCPGAEAGLAPIVWERPRRDAPGWAARAVENRHPVFTPGGRARGVQEVLVETPRHDADLWSFDRTEAEAWVDLYLGRMAAAYARPGLHVFAFRNRGRDAGASRAHPHGQLWAVQGPVPAHERRMRRLRAGFRRRGGCIVCRPGEPSRDDRTVAVGRHLRVEVPWAAREPWHMRVVPTRHMTSWTAADDRERGALAALLPALAAALRLVGGDPDYNLTFHDFGRTPAEGLHAHLEILPRRSRTAGFELASGVHINEGDPVSDAGALRRALSHLADRHRNLDTS